MKLLRSVLAVGASAAVAGASFTSPAFAATPNPGKTLRDAHRTGNSDRIAFDSTHHRAWAQRFRCLMLSLVSRDRRGHR